MSLSLCVCMCVCVETCYVTSSLGGKKREGQTSEGGGAEEDIREMGGN